MTYIWNRAERVDPNVMPEVVETSFNSWVKKQMKGFSKLSDKEKYILSYKINTLKNINR